MGKGSHIITMVPNTSFQLVKVIQLQGFNE